MNRTVHQARPLSSLPFYCHPVYLFLAAWTVMLSTLEVQVSESTFPDRSLGLFVFILSVVTMLLGFAVARNASEDQPGLGLTLNYVIDTPRLRRLTLWLGIVAVSITVFNWIFSGPPPLLGFFGFPTTNYLEYGRFKQVLFPATMTLFVNSLLEPSRARRWLWCLFSLGLLLVYVSRGNLILALAQGLILYSIRTSVSPRKIYIRAMLVVLFGFIAVDIIGNNRTSQDIFFEFMEIKADFRSWPMAFLWPVSYFSVPISNLCWMIHNFHFSRPAISFLYPVLPAFWTPLSPHEIPLSDPHIIDGVHTYLANYFLDFSWIGVVACNFGIGVLAGVMVNRQRISRWFLVSPVLLSAFGFIFFWDFFVYLPTLLECAAQLVIQKLCVVPVGGPPEKGIQKNLTVLSRGPAGGGETF